MWEPNQPVHSLAYFYVYDGWVKRVVDCLHQIIGVSMKINHNKMNCGGIHSMPLRWNPQAGSAVPQTFLRLHSGSLHSVSKWWSTCSCKILLHERPGWLFRLFIINTTIGLVCVEPSQCKHLPSGVDKHRARQFERRMVRILSAQLLLFPHLCSCCCSASV